MNCVRSYLRCAQVLGRQVLPGIADDPGPGRTCTQFIGSYYNLEKSNRKDECVSYT